jgi:quinol monooxygenase YgiN
MPCSISHITEGDGKVWPCVIGGVVVGALAAFGLAHVIPMPDCCKPKLHKKVHVLMVELEFESQSDRDKFAAGWSHLAKVVYDNEPNCLSYEMCNSSDDATKVIIYERYVTRADLSGAHQQSLRAHGELPVSHTGVVVKSKKLLHFDETNIGYMLKR